MQVLLFSLVALLLGLAMLVYGYRIFLVLLPVWGFFAGFWLGADVASLVLGSGFLGSVAGWAAGFVLGLILAVLSYLFYGVAVAIQAAVIGYAIGAGLLAAFFGSGLIPALSGVAFAVIVLILALAFNLQRYVVIVITSILGANAALLSGLVLFGRVTLESLESSGTSIPPMVRDAWWWVLIWLALAGAGVWSQIRANRSYEFRQEDYLEGWG